MFAGQEKSSIDKDAGIGSLNCGFFSAQSPKGSTNLSSFYQLILRESFYWTRKRQFWRPWRKIFAEVEFFLRQISEKFERNCKIFSEPIFSRSVSLTSNKAILTTLRKWFRRKTKFYRLKAEIDRKFVSFSKETIFWEKLPSTRRKQFWSSFRCNFCCSPAFSAKNCKNWTKVNTYHEKDFQLKVSWKKKGSFENVAEINLLSSNSPPLKNRKWWRACRFSAIWFRFEVLPGREKSGFMKKCYSTVFFAESANMIGKVWIL